MKAQEFFNVLGWTCSRKVKNDYIVYGTTIKPSQVLFDFDLVTKKVNIESIQDNCFLKMDEIDAVNTQYEELGWL